MKRRTWMRATTGLLCAPLLHAQAQVMSPLPSPGPSSFEDLLQDLPTDARRDIQAWTAGRRPVAGGVSLELPELVDNGNDVPLRVAVPSPMTPLDHVRRLSVWAPRNPQALVLEASFTAHMPRAELHTRIRLASTQRVWALVDTSLGELRWVSVPVLVALAACIEG